MSAQAPDWLILDGRRRMLFSEPLEPYLRDLPTWPDFRIDDGVNRRGYVATWEVKSDETLWLIGLETRPPNDGPDPGLRLVIASATGPIAATWVNQKLQSPDSDRRYDHRGYAASYARETILTVANGRIVLIEELHGGTGRRSSERFTAHLEAIFGGEEGAFLRSAHAAPEDSAPRLVYADWLEERGDPRSDVIRLSERCRDLDPAARESELRKHRDILLRGLGNPLWNQIMDYAELREALLRIG
jgi:uncharacterized protein (TIGR02996 family)